MSHWAFVGYWEKENVRARGCGRSECPLCPSNFVDNRREISHISMPRMADRGCGPEQENRLTQCGLAISLRNKARSEASQLSTNMFSIPWLERDKEQKRFYLLPGMGGRAYRRKRRHILYWSLGAGLLVSALLACVLYAMSGR